MVPCSSSGDTIEVDSGELRNRGLSASRSFSPPKYVAHMEPSIRLHNLLSHLRETMSPSPEKRRRLEYSAKNHSAQSGSPEDITPWMSPTTIRTTYSLVQRHGVAGRLFMVAFGILVIFTTLLQRYEYSSGTVNPVHLRGKHAVLYLLHDRKQRKIVRNLSIGSRERDLETKPEYKQVLISSNSIAGRHPSRDVLEDTPFMHEKYPSKRDERFLFSSDNIESDDDSVRHERFARNTSRSKTDLSPMPMRDDEIPIISFSLSERDSSIDSA